MDIHLAMGKSYKHLSSWHVFQNSGQIVNRKQLMGATHATRTIHRQNISSAFELVMLPDMEGGLANSVIRPIRLAACYVAHSAYSEVRKSMSNN